MNLDDIIRTLHEERKRIDRIIRTLEEQESGPKPGKSRRGRKSMDREARQQVSERMKRYWAGRREEQTGGEREFDEADRAGSSGERRYQAASVSPAGPGCGAAVTQAAAGRIQ